jgi:membrane-bound lytic murein transglycosylase A
LFLERLLPAARLERLAFDDLDGFHSDDLKKSWSAFLQSCEAIIAETPHQRMGVPYFQEQRRISKAALDIGSEIDRAQARLFFETWFAPFLIVPHENADKNKAAFFTAYYRPEVAASPIQTDEFSEPLFARPPDLVTLQAGQDLHDLVGLAAAQRLNDGRLVPFPTRSEIDSGFLEGMTDPIAFVADGIEAFMIHVQGSARLRFPNGQKVDLTYAGRNGRPYTSIGKIMIAEGEISLDDMSLDRLKAWVRENGQGRGQKGRALLHRNESFVFFSASPVLDETIEPVAAANVRLTAMRSIAVDRSLWPYGLPFWIEADIPWQDGAMFPFRQLMIAQDTGSAILGPARADLYFGTGDRAGILAGHIRHFGRMIVLMPKSLAP